MNERDEAARLVEKWRKEADELQTRADTCADQIDRRLLRAHRTSNIRHADELEAILPALRAQGDAVAWMCVTREGKPIAAWHYKPNEEVVLKTELARNMGCRLVPLYLAPPAASEAGGGVGQQVDNLRGLHLGALRANAKLREYSQHHHSCLLWKHESGPYGLAGASTLRKEGEGPPHDKYRCTCGLRELLDVDVDYAALTAALKPTGGEE